jgi:hypothetical protein
VEAGPDTYVKLKKEKEEEEDPQALSRSVQYVYDHKNIEVALREFSI